MNTKGKVITCLAAIAWELKKPLTIETIEVDPPKAGEVRIKIIASSLCHTDVALLDGYDDKAKFPCILGHEGSGIVESVGEGVTTLKEGDHVIPMGMPQCRECDGCRSPDTNICVKFIFENIQGAGVMADGTTRFSCKGQPVYNFINTSTFSQYTVCNEIFVAKAFINWYLHTTANSGVDPGMQYTLEKVSILGCGIPTGYGAAVNTAKVKKGSVCAIWGLGTIGLATVMGCREMGASRIIAVDINPGKFEIAKQFGATECYNPMDYAEPMQKVITNLTKGGCDYTFECIGTIPTMEAAFESCRRAGGVCIEVGVAAAGLFIEVSPIQLLLGKTLKGTALGGCKTRDFIPELVEKYMMKTLKVDEFITGNKPLSGINDAVTLLREGNALRTIIRLF